MKTRLRDYELSVSKLFENGTLTESMIKGVLTDIEVHDVMLRCVEKLPYYKIGIIRGVSQSCALGTCWRAVNKLMHVKLEH
jgi:hypothetical protein